MYRSNASADRVTEDRMAGNNVELSVNLAATQFVIPHIPLARKKISKGIPKTPTAKSITDCTRMINKQGLLFS